MVIRSLLTPALFFHWPAGYIIYAEPEQSDQKQTVFEYDRLIRSIYMLKHPRDPQMELNIRRSQNRIESYHQLRAAVVKVGGKK